MAGKAKGSPEKRKNKQEQTKRNPLAAGAPVKEICLKQLKQLCEIQPTQGEIAAFFGVSLKLIEKRMAEDEKFRAIVENGKEFGKYSLRRKMWDKAINQNDTTMQIWLSKNQLGMSDKVDSTNKNINTDLDSRDQQVFDRYFRKDVL